MLVAFNAVGKTQDGWAKIATFYPQHAGYNFSNFSPLQTHRR